MSCLRNVDRPNHSMAWSGGDSCFTAARSAGKHHSVDADLDERVDGEVEKDVRIADHPSAVEALLSRDKLLGIREL